MPIIFIDNRQYEVKAGKNLLEVSLALGFDLPYFCWHPSLGSVGACRQCAVKLYRDENDTQGRLVMSCMEGVRDGLRFSIYDNTAVVFRKQIIEWLMTNHPHDCPVCDEGGSCHLQDMTVMTGHSYRRYDFKKRTYYNQYLGPLIHHEMNRCIQCYRCVRYYRDYAGGHDLNVFAAHNHIYFGREKDGVLQSPFSGNLAEVCPTGVFTDKTLKDHYTRKWDLTMAPSVCHHCSVGCNTIAGERYGKIRAILNRYNGEVNGYFLCDRGRFGYEFVNSENRVKQPLVRQRVAEAVNETELLDHLKTVIGNSKLLGIGSPRASMESNFALQQLVGTGNFYSGVTENDAYLSSRIVQVLQSGTVHSVSLKEIEQADAIVILGEDVWNNAPMMALAVRQSVNKTPATNATHQLGLPVWHDAAIKEFVQEEKGLLVNVTVLPTPLDDISTYMLRAAPDDIARLGFAIAHELHSSAPAVKDAGDSLLTRARIIATALKQAKRPVIISGISNYNESVIKASFDIAASLNNSEIKAGIAFVLPECNSMGLAMMNAASFEQALARVQKESGLTVIIVENDLYNNISTQQTDLFFAKCSQCIVLDSLHNRTTEKASVLIPASTFAEGDGTLVNYEGRAQRFYQVFMPAHNFIKESWKWIGKMESLKSHMTNGLQKRADELLDKLQHSYPQFDGITNVSPPHQFTIHGERIPRETQRYSGRTAMLSNVHVSEPKSVRDDDSPLTFTMEGFKGIPPSSVIPFFWAPGWNSVQAVAKYQEEPGGSLLGGDPGVKLFRYKENPVQSFYKDIPEAFKKRQSKWLLLPQYHVLASGELSIYTKAIQELAPELCVAISEEDAVQLEASDGDLMSLMADNVEYELPLKVNKELCSGLALVSAGLPGIERMNWGTWIRVEKSRKHRNA